LSLAVLSVAYPFAQVGIDAVGGAEQVLARIDRALVEAGHVSIVVAREDSSPAGDLIPIRGFHGVLTKDVQMEAHRYAREAIGRALRLWKIDVVHFHGVDFHAYLPPDGVPALITLHLAPSRYPPLVFSLRRPQTYLHCVSRTQQQQCPPETALLPPIENGVPLAEFQPGERKEDYAITLGRICPEKGLHLAMEAAKMAGIRLLIGGEVFKYETHERYFHQEIAPRLDGDRQFLGPLKLDRKRRLLQAARCLLASSLIPETSSLAAMEALACGTPVIAFRSGALTEIVQDGVTGFLVDDVCEMADAIGKVATIDPVVCRVYAERHFAADRMVTRYMEVYDRIA
jgi:glycosyltransferase involved in cell wall biosynthesis